MKSSFIMIIKIQSLLICIGGLLLGQFSFAQSDTLQLITPIPKVQETSGLAIVNGQLWTHNDSGNPPILYRINQQNGSIEQEVIIEGIKNIDWEDIATDDTHFYIGDFGNNVNGGRQDLQIYKIPLIILNDETTTSIPYEQVEIIHFSYPSQTEFPTTGSNATDFDCEAMFIFNAKIHLFTKEWEREHTVHYTLPIEAGTYDAQQIAIYPIEGLVTAADISPDGKSVFLLGYDDVVNPSTPPRGRAFAWVFTEFSGHEFFLGTDTYHEFLGGFILNGQLEGVVYQNNEQLLIAAEKVSFFPARLYELDIITPIAEPTPTPEVTSYPNPFRDSLYIEISGRNQQVFLIDMQGKIVFGKRMNRSAKISIPTNIPIGNYSLQIQDKKGKVVMQKLVQKQ